MVDCTAARRAGQKAPKAITMQAAQQRYLPWGRRNFRWNKAGAELRRRWLAYMRTHPLAAKAVGSLSVHLLIIGGLLLSTLWAGRARAPRSLTPFDLQSLGPAGEMGGGPIASADASRAPDGLQILQQKTKPAPRAVKKTVPTRATRAVEAPQLSKNEIQRMLGSAVKNIGPGTGSGEAGTGSGGGVYDPLGWYYAAVRTSMYAAWQQPSALAGQQGLLSRVLIRVQRDGLITRRTLARSSGNALMDRSVLSAVEAVERLPELPPGFGGLYKEITIDFELTANATD